MSVFMLLLLHVQCYIVDKQCMFKLTGEELVRLAAPVVANEQRLCSVTL